MNDTERLVVLVEHLAEALEMLAAMMLLDHPARQDAADWVGEQTRAAVHEAHVIAGHTEDLS